MEGVKAACYRVPCHRGYHSGFPTPVWVVEMGAFVLSWGFPLSASLCGRAGGPMSIAFIHLRLSVAGGFASSRHIRLWVDLSVTVGCPALGFWVGEGKRGGLWPASMLVPASVSGCFSRHFGGVVGHPLLSSWVGRPLTPVGSVSVTGPPLQIC